MAARCLPEGPERRRAVILAELARRRQYRARGRFFPDDGPLSRAHYGKHTRFFALGATHPERVFMAGNRVGKTISGAYETACHLENQYPDWWEGTEFDGPVNWWACGVTNETTRDIVQKELLGPPGELGTGMIAKERIGRITMRGGIRDAVDTVMVRCGPLDGPEKWSLLQFKSYQMGRKAFEGTKKDGIWNDEEPPLDVYSEQVLRTASTTPGVPPGIMLNTFTPLEGMSETVLSFLPGGKAIKSDDRIVVSCGWDDVPHIPPNEQARLLASTPPYQHEARKNGTPVLGSGAIYPVAEADYTVSPFEIPKHWPRAYGLDVGWKATAALWGAYDRDNDVLYIYHEYKRGQAEPEVHARALKAPGERLKGACDPAARGRSQVDGRKLFNEYKKLDLNIIPAKNTVEAGIFEVYERLTTGRIRVFSTCRGFFDEIRLYRRDDKGRIVKEHDHLMDAFRYLVATLMQLIQIHKPQPAVGPRPRPVPAADAWMGKV